MLLYATVLSCTAMHWTLLNYTDLHCTPLHCIALHWMSLCAILHCIKLQCAALHCTAMKVLFNIKGSLPRGKVRKVWKCSQPKNKSLLSLVLLKWSNFFFCSSNLDDIKGRSQITLASGQVSFEPLLLSRDGIMSICSLSGSLTARVTISYKKWIECISLHFGGVVV